MDLRGQEKRVEFPSSFIYNPPIREPPSKISPPTQIVPGGDGERRRDGAGNGTTILTPQNLDQLHNHHHHHHQLHHHHHQQQQQQQQPTPTPSPSPAPPPPPPPPPQPQNQESDSDSESEPDPIPVSIAISGATIAPIGVGSNTNPRTPAPRSTVSTVRYRECLKNHAASIGGHVVDGCGEFMPSGEEGTAEALKCAACECHRNFHRKEVEGELQASANCYYYYNNIANTSRSRNPPPPALPAPLPPTSLLPSSLHKYQIGPTSPPSGPIAPIMMAFGGGGGGGGTTESSSEELNAFHSNAGGGATVAGHAPPPQFSFSKKRFRTKFSQEQKDKMLEFAEKIGWRMQKQDEALIQEFCAEAGVRRQVLKVWMHNNKHSMKKKEM